MCNVDGEIHLFIVWEKARSKQSEIIEDIKQKFKICDIFDVTWTKKKFSSNLTRFYGQKLPDRSAKEKHCGNGSFLLVIVRDTDPIYEDRSTSKGVCRVNVRTFDCKGLYRSWTGGGHKVHGTNDPVETRHDLVLLLGRPAESYLNGVDSPWNGTITPLEQDIVGADSWDSLADFFYVLNNTINYVVMRNFDELPTHHVTDIHGDIDLLTDDFRALSYVANGTRVFRKSYRVYYVATIGTEDVYFDFRHVGDSYYHDKWQKNILSNRIFNDKGIYVPDDINHFYSLLYHAAIHKPRISDDYVDKILNLSICLGVNIDSEEIDDQKWLRTFLLDFLTMRGYSFTDPKDLSVYLNANIVDLSTRRKVAKFFSLPIHQIKRVIKFIIRWESKV